MILRERVTRVHYHPTSYELLRTSYSGCLCRAVTTNYNNARCGAPFRRKLETGRYL